MKIISPFKDYYDGISHQYRDNLVVYERKTLIFSPENQRRLPKISSYVTKVGEVEYKIDFSILGFCGVLYPVLVVSPTVFKGTSPYNKDQMGFYSFEEFSEFARKVGIRLNEKFLYWRHYSYYANDIRSIKNFFSNQENYAELKRYFELKNTPCFLYEEVNKKDIMVLN